VAVQFLNLFTAAENIDVPDKIISANQTIMPADLPCEKMRRASGRKACGRFFSRRIKGFKMGREGLRNSRLADFEAVLLKEPGYTGLLRRPRILMAS
jgi:hypothetical protein